MIVAVFIIVCGLSILRNVKVTATTYHLLTISFLVYIAYDSELSVVIYDKAQLM